MEFGKSLYLMAVGLLGAGLANAGTISYTCDTGLTNDGTCAVLNSTVAADYSSTFTDASASIYIQYGTTGLASTLSYLNAVPYADYLTALTNNANKDALQVSSLASLANATTPYGTGNVGITVALAQALGIAGDAIGNGNRLIGTTSTGAACFIGNAGCYNAVVTVTNAPNTWYYDNNPAPGGQTGLYDIYAAIEHETDEVLGSSSCIGTQSSTGKLTDGCDFFGGTGTPSAADLYRYNSAGSLAVNANYIGKASAPAGAYFSYDGGATNGANGFVYNTLSNGDDYADFASTCGAPFRLSIQDAEGCAGHEAGQTILNDGGAEINILNAVGFDIASPEPGTMMLFGGGLAVLGLYRRGRRA